MRKEKLIRALDDFEAAYVKLLSALQSADFDPNDYINEDYPFEASFEEIGISQWVNSSIQKLGGKEQ